MRTTLLKITLFFISLINYSLSDSYAQLSSGGKPVIPDGHNKSSVSVFELHHVNPEELFIEDELDYLAGKKTLRFAKSFEVDLSPENSGQWITGPGDLKIWRLGIYAEGARSIGLIFSRYKLKNGVRLFIYDKDMKKILGGFTEKNNKPSGILPVSHLPGDFLIIHLEVPDPVIDYGYLHLGTVAHSYRSIFLNKTTEDGRFGLADTCMVDINCPVGQPFQDIKRSVCRIIIDSKELCSGALINSTRNDGKPYIFTAAHCLGKNATAESAVFYFQYESPECDGPDGSTDYTISGSTMVATSDSVDFSLVELSVAPPDSFRPCFAGWNRSTDPPLETATIHHPRGDVKKISFDYDPPETSYHTEDYYPEYILYSHWRILQWDVGSTEGGSSGSPLFDENKRIVGTLTGGEATCVNPADDYYTKFSYAWDYYDVPHKQLKCWLDPDSSGVLIHDSYDPGTNKSVVIPAPQELMIYPNPGNGWYVLKLPHSFGNRVQLRIYNISGQLVKSGSFESGNSYEIDITDQPDGLYFFVINAGSQIHSGLVAKVE